MLEYDIEAIAWNNCHIDDLWIFDKLILSKRLGYICGPPYSIVPSPGNYIIRPIMNTHGMSKGASIEYIKDKTEHIPPAHFWCEIFEGRHLSIDYKHGNQVLCVEGFRKPDAPLYRWNKWIHTDDVIPFPLSGMLKGDYEYVNCEFIGDKLIEVHLRSNPNFDVNTPSLEVIWDDDDREPDIVSPNYKRKGFIKLKS